ncbi:hypothetical protein LFYK43_01530 [Ligilactobacillus salitolerans]|uniref:Uncharacterized protein n=1 Tax=Ligilactobacillus salitolerans TaxID=1808352 RepID=A0A401IQB6_9LACO|nr:hypothetical protein LFYK43_01530 [Ligilactobacillus salitolerans]
MNNLIGLAVLLSLVLGILIIWWQKKHYYYLRTFFVKEKSKNAQQTNIIQLKASGQFVWNQTEIPNGKNQPARFVVMEGEYLKQADQIVIQPDKSYQLKYKNVADLVKNRPAQVGHAVADQPIILNLGKDKSVFLSGQALKSVAQTSPIKIEKLKKMTQPQSA